MAQRGRVAQRGWEELGYDGRARILRRAQKWMLDNAERVLDTVVSESGKTLEDAQRPTSGTPPAPWASGPRRPRGTWPTSTSRPPGEDGV